MTTHEIFFLTILVVCILALIGAAMMEDTSSRSGTETVPACDGDTIPRGWSFCERERRFYQYGRPVDADCMDTHYWWPRRHEFPAYH